MPVEIRQIDISQACEFPVCVVSHSSQVGAHVALWYSCEPPGSRRLLHQAWHYLTCDDTPAEFLARGHGCGPVVMVVPTLDEDEGEHLRLMCIVVAQRLRKTRGIGYAIDSHDVKLRLDGSFDMGASRGVTCATFVLKIFQALSIPFLLENTWKEITDQDRLNEDKTAHKAVVAGLRATARKTTDRQDREEIEEHARAIEAEIDAPRVRAEEIAAASGLTPRPGTYATVEPPGRAVLCAVNPSKYRPTSPGPGDPTASVPLGPLTPPAGPKRPPESSLKDAGTAEGCVE